MDGGGVFELSPCRIEVYIQSSGGFISFQKREGKTSILSTNYDPRSIDGLSSFELANDFKTSDDDLKITG